MLDGRKHVVSRPESKRGSHQGSDADLVISNRQRDKIETNARESYIEGFGVDPMHPKVEVIDGTPLPKAFVRRKIENALEHQGRSVPMDAEPLRGEYPSLFDPSPQQAEAMISGGCGLQDSSDRDPGPVHHDQSNGPQPNHVSAGKESPEVATLGSTKKIKLNVYIPTQSSLQPTEPVGSPTQQACTNLENLTIVGNMYPHWHYGVWTPQYPKWGHNLCLDHLRKWTKNTGRMTTYNEIHLGWVNKLKRNGTADTNDWWTVCAVNTPYTVADWPNTATAMHEISHLFNVQHHRCYWGGPSGCVMDYGHAESGGDILCTDHKEQFNWSARDHFTDNSVENPNFCW